MDRILEAVIAGVSSPNPQHAPSDAVIESWIRIVRVHFIRAPGAVPASALSGRMNPIILYSYAGVGQVFKSSGFDVDQHAAATVMIALNE